MQPADIRKAIINQLVIDDGILIDDYTCTYELELLVEGCNSTIKQLQPGKSMFYEHITSYVLAYLIATTIN